MTETRHKNVILGYCEENKDLWLGGEMLLLILIAVIYCCLPWYIELACFIVNLFIPDTVPIIDELLMFVPIVRKIKSIITVSEILEKYGKVMLVGLLAAIGIVIYLIVR